jgi:hypothetical protein
MTKRQISLYWREWQAAKQALVRDQGLLPSEAERERHRIHMEELGADKSSANLSNTDLDKVLAGFRAISRPDDLEGQIRQQDQPRIRLIYAIEKLGLEDAYLDSLAATLYAGGPWRHLVDRDLEHLRMTAKARVSQRRHHLDHDARLASIS